MARSDLNVRLGLELRDFEKGLRQAERSLRRTAQNLASIGQDLTLSVTTPILAAGGASLKAASEFEQLEKALIAVTGDAQEAQEQLERLRKIAEAPGIGFEQAVKASLQLQGLGFEAQAAENAITQVANAVAASGGGAEAFSGVVRQLGQIQAKNKVLQEDVGILLENAPILGKVLQETFGARTAEQIAALGVSGEQFVSQLVGSLEGLERVQGGLANSFENFGIAVRFALADVGQQINELFDVQGLVDGFVRSINQAVDIFRGLDDETKKTVVQFAALAAAIGPAVFATSRMVAATGTLIGLGRAFSTFLVGNVSKLAIYTGASTAAEVATKRFNLALRLTFAGAALAVVGVLVSKFLELRGAVKDSASAIRENNAVSNALNQVQKESASNIAAEVAQVEKLVEVAQDEARAQGERVNAIQSLQSQYPAYFGNIASDISNTDKLTGAKERLTSALLQEARARAAAQKINELASRGLELEEEIASKKAEQAKIGQQLAALGFDSLGDAVKQLDVNREIAASLAAQGKIIPQNIRALAEVVGQYQRAGLEANNLQAELIKLTQVQEKLSDIATDGPVSSPTSPIATITAPRVKRQPGTSAPTAPKLDASAIVQGASSINDAFASINTTFGEVAEGGLASINSGLGQLTAFDIAGRFLEAAPAMGFVSDAAEQAAIQFAKMQEKMTGIASIAGGILTEGFTSFFETVASGGSNVFDGFIQAIKKLIVQLAAAVATAAALALLFTVISGGSATGLAKIKGFLGFGEGSLFKNFFKFPGLAEGGIVPPGYPGDTYPALLTSGETVLPPKDLNTLMNSVGNGGPLTGEIRLNGNDLVVALERFSNNRSRTRGR